jgi:hypothetical protein
MSDFLLALLAALMSTLGSLILQVYVSRNSRRMLFDEKRLQAVVSVRQEVEIACGRWRGWAESVLNNFDTETVASRKRVADECLHGAWYSTRVFEMYFPQLRSDADSMRQLMMAVKDEAEKQVSDKKKFDGKNFELVGSRIIDLDDVVSRARRILALPS